MIYPPERIPFPLHIVTEVEHGSLNLEHESLKSDPVIPQKRTKTNSFQTLLDVEIENLKEQGI